MNFVNFLKQFVSFFNLRRSLIFLLSAVLILFLSILIFSDGFNGGEDTIIHYNNAHWALSNSAFLVDGGNNPLFTLLSIPFAIFGFKAFQFFNIILGVASAYIAFLIARELKMKSPALAIAICCFTPIFMENLFSGITEILFGFIAVLVSFLFIKKRYVLGAIILSFLPMVGVEGYFILPVYAIFLIKKKQVKTIAFLITGFLIYSIVGTIAGKDFFWLLADIDYSRTSEVYGSGGLFQYIKRSPGYFGIANEIFFVTGLVAGISLYFRHKKESAQEFILVVMPFVVYFMLEAFAWYLGIGNSKGLTRYMVAIVPFMAIIATRGLVLFSLMFEILFKSEKVRKYALAFAFVSVIIIPFHTQSYPIKIGNLEKTIKEASAWIKNNSYSSPRIVYTSPLFSFYHEQNPYNELEGKGTVDDVKNLENEIDVGEYLVIDEIHAPVQGINLESVLGNPYFELLKFIEPEIPVNAFERNYLVAIFRRTEKDVNNITNNLLTYNNLSEGYTCVVSHDFSGISEHPQINIETELSSKNRFARISRNNRYSIIDTIEFNGNESLPITLQVEFKQSKEIPDENLRYVVEMIKDGRLIAKKVFQISAPRLYGKNEWHTVNVRVQLPEITDNKGSSIVTYFWNKRKKGFSIDDYSVAVKTEN